MPIMLRPLQLFADFNGRARRAEYWQFWLLQVIVYIVLIFMALLSLMDMSSAFFSLMIWIGVICLVALVLFIPNLAVLARRLHDANLSAWWMLLLLSGYLPHIVTLNKGYSTFARAFVSGDSIDARNALMRLISMMSVIMFIATVCSLILFVMTLLPGTKGANRFGPDPKSGQNNDSSGFDETKAKAAIDRAKEEQERLKSAVYRPNPVVSAPYGSSQRPSFGKRR